MRYKVLINRHSIKLNPRAGQTITKIPHAKRYFMNGCEVDVFVFENFRHQVLSGNLDATKFRYEVKIDFVEIQHRPEPLYLYEYEPKWVKCFNCQMFCWHTQLQSDDVEDRLITEICPHCRTPGCVELEFENINDVLKEYHDRPTSKKH